MNRKSVVFGPLVVIFSFACLACVLVFTKYMPIRNRLIILVVAVIGAMVVMIVTKRPFWRYLIAICILVTSVFVFSSQKFVDQMADTKEYELIKYDLLRMKDHEFEKNPVIGLYGVKENHLEAISEDLKSELGTDRFKKFSDIDDVVSSFYAQDIDGLFVNKAMLANLSFLYPDFMKDTILVNSYEYRLSRDSIVKHVDVLKEPFTIYLSGIDVYGDVVTRSRSDMNLLLTVNPKTNEVLTVSVPRDTYVPLGCENGELDKLTHAGLYGVTCSVKTLEKLFNIDINYYIRVNFTGLVQIVDTLEGVDVLSHYDFITENGDVFVKGMNHVDGEKALAFARERDHVEYGDVARGLHHQELVKAIFEKATQTENIIKAPQLTGLVSQVVDTNLDDGSISKLISKQIETSDKWHFEEDYLRGEGDMQPTYSQDGRYKYYVYWPSDESVASIQKQISDLIVANKEGS
ncbi:LCP family protein [Erysipelothrix rhusiopathiae]|nr:LCP family protein [Erysipelothrix rhusiopathiae]MDE8172966.1 LCP family protein [Erysipelothrix rhusiopathiae]MDE8181708.1 LCP family protein [Erysipelothrix rhusiopathiae]MDE9422792.1 LCP family protein [Erysipelothrix rhusiopathiae]